MASRVLVAKAVTRLPSMTVTRSRAPGCGRPRRMMTRIPGGQPLRFSTPVSSGDERAVADVAVGIQRGAHACSGISSQKADK